MPDGSGTIDHHHHFKSKNIDLEVMSRYTNEWFRNPDRDDDIYERYNRSSQHF